jgi:hypothetical protein
LSYRFVVEMSDIGMEVNDLSFNIVSKVAAYAKYMAAHPASSFGVVGGSYDVPNQVDDIKQAHLLREKQNKLFQVDR